MEKYISVKWKVKVTTALLVQTKISSKAESITRNKESHKKFNSVKKTN